MRKDDVQKALQTLIDLGLVVRFDDSVEVYHGRAGIRGENWSVDPNFSNAGNNTGNMNLNSIPALNAADQKTASEFATKRAFIAQYKAENMDDVEAQVHRIVADGEAYIFVYRAIKPENQEIVKSAMRVLLGSNLTRFAPLSWEDRLVGEQIYKMMREYLVEKKHAIFTVEDARVLADRIASPENMSSIFGQLHLPYTERGRVSPEAHIKGLVYQMAGAMNTRYALLKNPSIVVDKYVIGKHKQIDGLETWDMPIRQSEGEKVDDVPIPMSSAYVSSLLDSSNIVGFKQDVTSVTVGKDIVAYYLFDQERINTEKAIGEKHRRIIEEYERLDEMCSDIFSKRKVHKPELMRVIENGSPEEIIDYISSLSPFDKLYAKDSGVWEGFSVKQHTESVLRWFDTNYKNALPKNVETFMKVCILSHDIGKGVAYEHGGDQKTYNGWFAASVFDAFGFGSRLSRLGQYIIGDGQQKTTSYYIRKQKTAKEAFESDVEPLLTELGYSPTEAEIEGLWQLCSILQNCDSGSYTRRGVTRTQSGYHSNANFQFTESFTDPVQNSGQRGGKLKEPGDS